MVTQESDAPATRCVVRRHAECDEPQKLGLPGAGPTTDEQRAAVRVRHVEQQGFPTLQQADEGAAHWGLARYFKQVAVAQARSLGAWEFQEEGAPLAPEMALGVA